MSGADITRGDVWWIALDPTQGSEVRKTRPCLVLSHNTLNRLRRTIVVVPLSSAAAPHPPITVEVTCEGKPAVALADQVRAVAKSRLRSRIEAMNPDQVRTVGAAVVQVLALAE